jgi:superfamily II RNA helicase
MQCDADMEMDSAKTLMKGVTAPLVSSFKLTYYTLLNMMKRSAGGALPTRCERFHIRPLMHAC